VRQQYEVNLSYMFIYVVMQNRSHVGVSKTGHYMIICVHACAYTHTHCLFK